MQTVTPEGQVAGSRALKRAKAFHHQKLRICVAYLVYKKNTEYSQAWFVIPY